MSVPAINSGAMGGAETTGIHHKRLKPSLVFAEEIPILGLATDQNCPDHFGKNGFWATAIDQDFRDTA